MPNRAILFLVIGLVIVKNVRPYSSSEEQPVCSEYYPPPYSLTVFFGVKIADDSEGEMSSMNIQSDDSVAPSAISPAARSRVDTSDDANSYQTWQDDSQSQQQSPSQQSQQQVAQQGQQAGGQAVQPKRWHELPHPSASASFERDEGSRTNCPPRYEEIIGYCADSPIGNPLAFNRYRCASQCNLNQECLGYSWDKEADGKAKPYSCTLQHTECRFPTYSTRFGFCRKKLDKSMKPMPPFPTHHVPPPPPPPPPVPVPIAPIPVVAPAFEMPPFDLPPIRITEEPNTEILRAYLSTYDQICDSDKHFKTTTVFTCAQYCLADAGCQAFAYDQSIHVCRFIGHCQQKQVFKKRWSSQVFGSSGMPDILSLLNFILSRASLPPGLMGSSGFSGLSGLGSIPPTVLAAAASGATSLYPGMSHRAPIPSGPMPLLPSVMPPYKTYTSSEEFYLNRRGEPIMEFNRHHGHSQHGYDKSAEASSERRIMNGYERFDGDCQSPLLDNKIYELNVYDCARKCHRKSDCSGFSVNLYVSSPHECYLRAESCSTPVTSNAWVYFRKMDHHNRHHHHIPRVAPSEASMSPNSPATQNEEAGAPHQNSQQKSDKMFAFYDFLQGSMNKTAPAPAQSQVSGLGVPQQPAFPQQSQPQQPVGQAPQAAQKPQKMRPRKPTEQDQPTMTVARRALTSPAQASAVHPQSRKVPVPPMMDAAVNNNKTSVEKALEYYTPLPGNCKGSVLDQVRATLAECAVRCIHTTKCLGFAYDQWDEKCYIKANKCLNPEPSPNGVVYYQLRM